MKLNGFGISDIGRVRQVNQDSLFYRISPSGDIGIFASFSDKKMTMKMTIRKKTKKK